MSKSLPQHILLYYLHFSSAALQCSKKGGCPMNVDLLFLNNKAMEAVGIAPITVPIRGGTDGARLSYMGLPCPNLCTGGANFHSRFEYIPVEDMERITQMLVQLLTPVES